MWYHLTAVLDYIQVLTVRCISDYIYHKWLCFLPSFGVQPLAYFFLPWGARLIISRSWMYVLVLHITPLLYVTNLILLLPNSQVDHIQFILNKFFRGKYIGKTEILIGEIICFLRFAFKYPSKTTKQKSGRTKNENDKTKIERILILVNARWWLRYTILFCVCV